MHPCQYFTQLCVQLSAKEGIQFLTIRYFNGFAVFLGHPAVYGTLMLAFSSTLILLTKSPNGIWRLKDKNTGMQ
jgi:hypothetical protein